jgi:transposase
MLKPHDDSKACLTAFVQDNTLTVVIEMSLRSWLVAGTIPGVDREPRKKIGPDPEVLLQLLYRWRDEAIKVGKEITRIAVAYETGRDGFWLARWLRARGIFPHRDRESLVKLRTSTVNRMKSILIQFGVRNFNPVLRKAPEKLDSLRTPEGIPVPPNAVAALRRQMERFRVIKEQVKMIERTRLQRLQRDPAEKFNAMVFLLVRIIGLGLETAEQLVHEILSRHLRDRKAVARYAGLTGSPDESGSKRREKGLSRSGNGRVRNILIQLSWRLLRFQLESNLVLWFKERTADAKRSRKPMIVAFARKLIIALWRYVNTGLVPEGFQLRSAA